ncbi:hypothetical protein [Rhodococcus jostii]|uniref:hypothetical protein n=1 Tax=Rhodococcus jostii TaxID=132919 RepID=UPI00365B1433
MTSAFLDEACGALGESETVLEVAVCLLRFCRSNKVALAQMLRHSENREIVNAWVVAAEDRIKSLPPFVPVNVRQGFIDDLREADDPVLVARALVVAIDEYASDMLRSDDLIESSHGALDREEILVYPRGPIKKLYPPGVKFTTSYANRPNSYEVDRTPSLTIGVPSSLGFEIEIDRVSGQYLDAAMRKFDTSTSLFGALVPSQTECEFDFPRLGDGYFGVRPKNENLQNEILIQLLRLAGSRRVTICAAPELSCFDSTLDKVLEIDSGELPNIVYVGSVHKHCASKKVNRAYLVYPEYRHYLHHDKVSFFTERDGHERIQEAIDLGGTIRFHWGRDWSMVALTCADFLDPTVRKALAELRPSFIVVGAMSKKTDSFEAHARELASAVQSHVLIVNGPRGWGDDVISGRPVVAMGAAPTNPVVTGRCAGDQHAVAVLDDLNEVIWAV